MSRYEDDLSRGRSSYSRDRDRDRDYAYAYADDRHSAVYEPGNRRTASPGYTTYNGNPSQARLTYEPQSPLYAPRASSALQIPESHSRPRSLPPLIEYRRSSRGSRRERGYSKHGGSDGSDVDRARTPVRKTKNFVDNTFTDSRTGLGVGVLGALVGGLAAREAAEATSKHNGHRHDDDNADRRRSQILSTVVGAAVGALGANAVEKRIEMSRERDRAQQDRWDRRWRPAGGARGDRVVEKREFVSRPRSSDHGGGSGSSRREWDRDSWEARERERNGGGRRRGVEREVDPGARSWKNVEDWLYDDGNDLESGTRSNGQPSHDAYRY